jgi:hypothetical protein
MKVVVGDALIKLISLKAGKKTKMTIIFFFGQK